MDGFITFDFSSSGTQPFLEPDQLPALPAFGLGAILFQTADDNGTFDSKLNELSAEEKANKLQRELCRLPTKLTTKQLEQNFLNIVERFSFVCKESWALVEMGKFAKENYDDVMVACSYYCQAMGMDKNNQEARCQYDDLIGQVEKVDKKQLARVQLKIFQLSQQLPFSLNRIPILREEFYQIIQQTCAIEDNPLTLRQVKQLLKDVKFHDGGKEMDWTVKEIDDFLDAMKVEEKHILEVLGATKAFMFVLKSVDEWVKKKKAEPSSAFEATIDFLLQIHQRAVENDLKALPGKLFSSVKGNTVQDYRHELEKIFEWINTALKEEKRNDRISLVAVSHHLLVNLHMFKDGNGRSTRALMDYLLMICGYPPTIIPSQRMDEYIRALNIAHLGDHRPIVRFVADCIEHTADRMLCACQKSAQKDGDQEMVKKPTLEHLGLTATTMFNLVDNSPVSFTNSNDDGKQNEQQGNIGSSSSLTHQSRSNWAQLFLESLVFDSPSPVPRQSPPPNWGQLFIEALTLGGEA